MQDFERDILASIGGAPVNSGVKVTPQTALGLSAVYACIRLISNYIAMVPLKLYREQPNGNKTPATNHPLYRIVNSRANPYMTAYELKRYIGECLLSYGNFYGLINPPGLPPGIYPVHPAKVTPRWNKTTNLPEYYVDVDGVETPYEYGEILHLAGLGYDGLSGKSPISVGAEGIGVGLAQQQYAAQFYGRGINPGGILTTDAVLTRESRDAIKQRLEQDAGGIGNSHRPLVLEQGLKWQQITISPADAQLIESRKFSAEEICRIFGVPARKIIPANTSTTERDQIEYVQDCILPWLTLIEQGLDAALLSEQEIAQGYTFGFAVTGLYRADYLQQAQALNLYRNNGIVTANEARAMIGLGPINDGDVLLCNGNLIPVETAINQSQDAARQIPSQGGDTNAAR